MRTQDKLRNTMETLALKINNWNISTSNPSYDAFENVMNCVENTREALDSFDRLLAFDIKDGEANAARNKLEQLVTESIQEKLS